MSSINVQTAFDFQENEITKTGSTFIWLIAESFKPVISKILMHARIDLPYFFVASGYKNVQTNKNLKVNGKRKEK